MFHLFFSFIIPSFLAAAETAPRAVDILRQAAYTAFVSGKSVADELPWSSIIDSCQAPPVDGDEDLAKACSLVKEVSHVQSGTDGNSAALRQQAFDIIDLMSRFKTELRVENSRPSDEVVLDYRNRRIGVAVAVAPKQALGQRRQKEARARALAVAQASAAAAAFRSYSASRGLKDAIQYTKGLDDDTGYFIVRDPDGTKSTGAIQWKQQSVVWVISKPNGDDAISLAQDNHKDAGMRRTVAARVDMTLPQAEKVNVKTLMRGDGYIPEFVRQIIPERWR